MGFFIAYCLEFIMHESLFRIASEHDYMHMVVRNDDDVVICRTRSKEHADIILTALNAYIADEGK
jgi:predicted dehydrogenase